MAVSFTLLSNNGMLGTQRDFPNAFFQVFLSCSIKLLVRKKWIITMTTFVMLSEIVFTIFYYFNMYNHLLILMILKACSISDMAARLWKFSAFTS